MSRAIALRMAKANKARKHVSKLRMIEWMGSDSADKLYPGAVQFFRPLTDQERAKALREYRP